MLRARTDKSRSPALAYLRTSSAANVGTDKDSEKRQRHAIQGFAKRAGFAIVEEFYDAAVSGADSLGVYPSVSLKDARDKADAIRRAARNGVDLRQQHLDGQARSVSFKEAFETYFAVKCKQLSNAKHLKQWPSTMASYVFPVFGDAPISDITTAQVLDALIPIWYDKPETAKRVLQRVEAVFKSAILRGAREKASPCVGVAQELQTRHREVRHHPALPWREVPAFIARLRSPVKRGREAA
jgi:hypothetical protein